MTKLEVILRDRNSLEDFNERFMEDVKRCYKIGVGMPVGQQHPNLPEYITKVYMPALYNGFILTYTAGKKRPKE
jgi:hypothetical protein